MTFPLFNFKFDTISSSNPDTPKPLDARQTPLEEKTVYQRILHTCLRNNIESERASTNKILEELKESKEILQSIDELRATARKNRGDAS